ncbi:hypothetical protein [Halomonas casei]|uniref:hypothetical protein n=1 Tax=Halomonas casei TaxID=2742613 RepID=UPI003CEA067E
MDDNTDRFYEGYDAFQSGKSESNMPENLSEDGQRYWLAGFRKAAHTAENPPLPVDEYHRIADLGYSAGLADSKNGSVTPNPFDADQEPEQNDIWAASYLDGSGNGF